MTVIAIEGSICGSGEPRRIINGTRREGRIRMANVLTFPPPSMLVRRRRHEKVLRAKELIFRAAELLGDMGEGEMRIAWLLEDCVGLLEGDAEAACQGRSLSHEC